MKKLVKMYLDYVKELDKVCDYNCEKCSYKKLCHYSCSYAPEVVLDSLEEELENGIKK